MKNLNQTLQKIKPYLLSILLIVGSLVLLIAVGVTSFVEWQDQRTLLTQINLRLTDLNIRKAAIDKLNSSSVSLSQLETLVDGVLADDSSVPVVMGQIQQIAAETGVSVIALQFAGGTTTEVKAQTSVSGPYASVQNFLGSVESSGRLLLVTALHFSSADASSQNGASVTATLDITNPYFSGKVDQNSDITKLVQPEFSALAKKLSSYHIYIPRVGQGAVGKQNPFLK